ncbi:MAG: hypothetical protein RDV41_12180, partial [Planctomycetota bacterium]|nr:hypothetical protein [Planctomycetota bacterium]
HCKFLFRRKVLTATYIAGQGDERSAASGGPPGEEQRKAGRNRLEGTETPDHKQGADASPNTSSRGGDKSEKGSWWLPLIHEPLVDGLPPFYDDPFTHEDAMNCIRRDILAHAGYPERCEQELSLRLKTVADRDHAWYREEVFSPEFLAKLEADKEHALDVQQRYLSALLTGEQVAKELEREFVLMLKLGRYPLFPEVRDMLVRAWHSLDGVRNDESVRRLAVFFAWSDTPESMNFLCTELQTTSDSGKAVAIAKALSGSFGMGEGFFEGTSDVPRAMERMRELVHMVGRALVAARDPAVRAGVFGVLTAWAGDIGRALSSVEGDIAREKQRLEACSPVSKAAIAQEVQKYQEKADPLRTLAEAVKGYQQMATSGAGVEKLPREERKSFMGTHLDIQDASQRALAVQLLKSETDPWVLAGVLGDWSVQVIYPQAVAKADLSDAFRDIREVLYEMANSSDPKQREFATDYLTGLENSVNLDNYWAAKLVDPARPMPRPDTTPYEDEEEDER